MISPPCSPAPGPMSIDPVRRPDRLLVVLDDEHGVAEVAQPRQRGDQLGVVALVEPDRRLVEDVQDAHQRRADLGRQPDPLRLAARQADRSSGRASGSPGPTSTRNPSRATISLSTWWAIVRSRSVTGRRGPVAQSSASVTDSAETSADVAAVDGHREDLRPQPLAAAGRARLLDHELLELGPDVLRLRLAVAALEVRDRRPRTWRCSVFSPRSCR